MATSITEFPLTVESEIVVAVANAVIIDLSIVVPVSPLRLRFSVAIFVDVPVECFAVPIISKSLYVCGILLIVTDTAATEIVVDEIATNFCAVPSFGVSHCKPLAVDDLAIRI